jgi:carboxyl-terminal processing protease
MSRSTCLPNLHPIYARSLFYFLIILSCSYSSYCSAEQGYLQIKDINTIMKQILDQHLDKKEMTISILKNSFKVYIDQFDPERIYLLQQEVEPYLKMSDERLTEFVNQYKLGQFAEYADLNRIIENSITRSRKIRANLESSNPAALFQESSKYHADGYEEWRDPDLRKFFTKSESDLALRIKEELIRFIASQKKRYGDAYIQNRQIPVLNVFEKEMRQHENEYLFLNDKNQPMSQTEKQNAFVMHILKALASSLDAHTTVLNPVEAQDMRIRLEKEIQGIGIGLQQNSEGNFIISHLVEGGPAEKSKQVQINDRLLEVDGKSVQGQDLNHVMALIRGKTGTSITLLLARSTEDNPIENNISVRLTREEITVNENRVDTHSEIFGNGIIGIIKLDSFYQGDNGITIENDVLNAIKKLDKQGNLRGLIIDLRENSGGFLSQAVKVVGLFITNGVVVVSKYFNGEEHFYRDVDGKKAFDGPLIILTSKATASAAEIVAQALQDYGIAVIVGDKHTYGKGTIQSQTVTQEGNTAYFKVTVGTYYTVSGKTPQIQGVKADIEVPSLFAHENIGEEFLDYPVKQDNIAPTYDDDLSDIAPNLKPWYLHYYTPTLQHKKAFWQNNMDALRKNSQYRMSHNKNYQAFLKGEEPSLSSGEKKQNANFGTDDLQMSEAINIMKDMIILHSRASGL